MIVPTKRFWALLGLGVLLGLAGAFVPGLERALLPYNLLLLFLLVASARLVPKRERFRAVRRFDPVLSVRVSNRVDLDVDVDSPREWACRVRDEPPPDFGTDRQEVLGSVDPERPLHISYHVTPNERGADYFRGTFVRVQAPLGLAEVEYRLPSEQPARVYPNVQALKEFDLLKQKGRLSLMGIRRSRIKGLGTEFESLRDYNEDDYRRIDWKTTARRGKLVVRDYEQERNQAVIICLDIGKGMLGEVGGVKKLDHSLDACLMLMHAAAVAGDQVGLMVFGENVRRYIPPRKGRSHNGVILEAVHNLEAEPAATNYSGAFSYLASRWKRRSLIIVFTDAEDERQATEVTRGLSAVARRHLVMVVRVSDPRLKDLVGAAVADAPDLYKKAAALWYASERRKAEAWFRIANLQGIEAEPQDLSSALVSAYLRVKERSAL
ncbi:MAG TPA: DUF58 domain-containing protein [Fimbriimonadaceae bacterium]|nr:DUF58 domain-containing protein [Fimbriimonadaceae bacterium]HRJ95529.1 DUF58 domain-containing protein [Fimbriimonadaceae bacterium]